MMSGGEKTGLMEHFSGLEDPRRSQGRRHNLLDIIAMTICAVVAGAEGWDDVELFAQCKEDWFRTFLEFPNGIPCSDTFARVFARLDPDRFRECFTQWGSRIHQLTQGQAVTIDGKTLRPLTTGGRAKRQFTWSAPGPRRAPWCWIRPGQRPNPTRPPPSPNCWRCWN